MIALLLTSIVVQQTTGKVVIRADDYALVVSKERGDFDLLLRLPDGNLVSVVRQGGERFWFGYNDREGEKRTDRNRPKKIAVRERRGAVEVEVECPVDPRARSVHRAVYIAMPDFVIVRSTILAKKTMGKVSIVRVAPRADVNLSLLTHYAASTLDGGRRVVSGEVEKLGRPGYVGVRPWGGPIKLTSLDPEAPFLALYNPERKIGFLLLYPFYSLVWERAQIFLQRWHGGANFLYCGFGDDRFLAKEFLFAIAPARAFNPEGLREQAEKLTKTIEAAVLRGDFHYPRLERLLKVERDFGRLSREIARAASSLVGRLFERRASPSEALRALRRARFLLSLAQEAMDEERLDEALSFLREAAALLRSVE